MLPEASAATPSAALVVVAFSTGSGMNAVTEPSRALPILIRRFRSIVILVADSDSDWNQADMTMC
jgi:hypothetical protein